MSTKDEGGDDEWPAAAKGGARRRTCEDDEWPAATDGERATNKGDDWLRQAIANLRQQTKREG